MTKPGRPLRILHLTAGSDLGGVSRYLRDLCEAMHAQGHHVTIAGERGKWSQLFDSEPWPWLDISLKGGYLKLRRAASQLVDHLCDHPVDLLHVHYRKAAIVGRWLARRFRLPMLFTLHVTGIPMRGIWRWLSDFGDHTHAPSQMAQQWLIDVARVDSNRITIIPHGIVANKFPVADAAQKLAARRALGLPANGIVAAFVGRYEAPKNEGWVINLAAASRQRLPDLYVVMIGQGPNESVLHRRVQSEGLTDRVVILPYGDPMPVYGAADAVLLPSSREGFSLVTTEAMSTGRPVLRTRTAGTAEHIIENVTGRSVPISLDAFLEGAMDFLSNSAALSRMGLAAAKHVRQNMEYELQLERTLSLYWRLIDVAG